MRFRVGNINVYVADDYEQMSKLGAMMMASQIHCKPASVLGFATGSTQEGLYSELVRMHGSGLVDFSQITTFNLDEYYPIQKTNKQSYHHYMHHNLFNHVNVPKANIHIPNGEAADAEAECTAYERAVCGAGGIDMQLLGIGNQGHIAFNECGDTFVEGTHVVELAQGTIEANSRFFAEKSEMPTKALSMGIGSIMQAKRLLLLATGMSKADVVKRMLYGDISPRLPASVLRLHRHADVIITKDIGEYITYDKKENK